MKSGCGYKGYIIEVRLSELKDGGVFRRGA
jgi:hypothetical protein